jgi:hypothetical protein
MKPTNHRRQPLAANGRKALAVINAGNHIVRLDYHGTSDYRTGKSTSPDFVDARDTTESRVPYLVLQTAQEAQTLAFYKPGNQDGCAGARHTAPW